MGWPLVEPLFAIDSSIYIFRSYFALQPDWQSRDGFFTEAVFGFASFLLKLLARENPVYIGAAFDESLGTGFRHQLYGQYKANRALPDEALGYQLDSCRRIAESLGIACWASSQFEADDYLAAMVAAASDDQQVYILSADKDLAQLLSDRVWLWDYPRKARISGEDYREKFGVMPELVPDLLALTGDVSDNIPGVPGIGPKTATAILAELGAIENWVEDLSKLLSVSVRGSKSLPVKLTPYRDQIRLAKKLAVVEPNIPSGPQLSSLLRKSINLEQTVPFFEHLGIASLVPELKALKEKESTVIKDVS